MTNAYLDKFTELVDASYFIVWLSVEASGFFKNMQSLGVDNEKKELREWLRWFLDWSEYNENKDGGADEFEEVLSQLSPQVAEYVRSTRSDEEESNRPLEDNKFQSCDNYLTTSAGCRCNAEHAHMTYVPHEHGCPAKPRASHPKCQACGDTGVVGVYFGEGEFEFYPCERCGRTNQ